MLLAPHNGQAEASRIAIDGTVVHVTDGDTLWLRPDAAGAAPFKLRLAGIDAPERCQSGGAQAGAALAARVLHKRVQALTRATDDYKRAVATVHVDGEDIGAWLVLQGHAWARGYRRSPGPYARQEAEARAARRGLFADPQAQDPRAFRRQHGPCG
jgi:endonuclease YncB( thermonuclease family)